MNDDKFKRLDTIDNFITEKVDIIKNNLLGSYEKGKYFIAPQIVNELVDLKKVRKSSYDNSIFCVGNLLGFGEILFEIKFEKTRDAITNQAKAKLFVLEEVNKVNGYLQNTIRTQISEYTSLLDNFIQNSFDAFNVINDDEDDGQEKKSLENIDLDDSYILAKKAYMLLLDKFIDEKVLDAYGKYFTARLSILSRLDSGFSNAVLASFNNKYTLIENVFLKDKNYKALNELLDSCIEEISSTKETYINEEQVFKDAISKDLQVFTDNVNKLNDRLEQKVMNSLDKSDRDKLNQMNEFDKSKQLNETKITSGDNHAELNEDLKYSRISAENEMISKSTENIENPILFEEDDNKTNEVEEKEVKSEQEIIENGQIEENQQNILTQISQLQKENEVSIKTKVNNDNFIKNEQSDNNSSELENISHSMILDKVTQLQNESHNKDKVEQIRDEKSYNGVSSTSHEEKTKTMGEIYAYFKKSQETTNDKNDNLKTSDDNNQSNQIEDYEIDVNRETVDKNISETYNENLQTLKSIRQSLYVEANRNVINNKNRIFNDRNNENNTDNSDIEYPNNNENISEQEQITIDRESPFSDELSR